MCIYRRISITCIVLLASYSSSLSAEQEHTTNLADQTHLAVTIYNDNLALIKDQRKISLPQGDVALAYREISARILPETALLRSMSQMDAINVIEQNFDFDLLSPQKLLQKYIGQEIGIRKIHPTTGEERIEYGTLLSTHQEPVIKFGERIETGHHTRFVFPSVPGNLRDKPTLIMQLSNSFSSEQTLELSYLSQGFSWKADYVMSLNSDDSAINLNGWVTLINTSGTAYPNAQLQLVAGNIHRAPSHFTPQSESHVTMDMLPRSVPPAQENLFEYHLYTLNHKTTLSDNQTKQVALLNAVDIPIKKELRLLGNQHYYYNRFNELGQKLPIDVFILFTNNERSHLGMPLPMGVIRAYKTDSQGSAQFIGEDRIEHTAKNEDIRIKLGSAFDVTASKKQTAFSNVSPHITESEYLIVLKNAKTNDVTVNIVEPIPGDWQILRESLPHDKTSSTTASWQVKVPANGETQLTYRVQIK